MSDLFEDLRARYGQTIDRPEGLNVPDAWHSLAARRSHRRFLDKPVAPALIETLAALAFSAPSKSDLQQRDILLVEDTALRRALDGLVADQPWVAEAPTLLVVLANNRRQRLVHQWRGRPFANDHLDAFFNAAVDGGIALAALVLAAEAIGLGCCPVSAIRNQPEAVSRLLALPDHVFPVAGLALGWPAEPGAIVPRLPLAVTLHKDRYQERDLEARIAAYDTRRPYETQRDEAAFGHDPAYGWSEDKARQYAKPERVGFGAFIRAKGFDLS
ncbi:MAG: nitroreductase family protein [Pseudomonadota bacterium]